MKFNQLCSALDLIGDTEQAVAAYWALPPDVDLGNRYLALYGLWQAFQQQQDAVKALANAVDVALGKAWKNRIGPVRRMRSAVAGHTVDTAEGGKRLSHQVSQVSLRTTGFDLLSHADDGTYNFETVDVVQYADRQRQLMEEALTRVESELRQRNRKHRMEFKGVKFARLLDKVGYPLEKVLVGGHDPGGPQFVLLNVKELESVIEGFRAELDRRGIGFGTYDGTERCLGEINYTLAQLRMHFDGTDAGEVKSDHAAYVFARYLRETFNDLAGMARELNDEYERDD